MASSLEFSSIVFSSKESPSVGHLGFQRSPEGSIPRSTNVRFQQCFKVRATQVSESADAISRPGHMEVQSLYEVLGVSQGATAKDNKTAYIKLAREFHPDHAASPQMRPLPSANSVEAVLFDVDGTLVDSDPLHFLTFRDMLQEVGFQGGIPITEEFFSKNISGNHNDDIGAKLFPDWDESQRQKFTDDKEAVFRSKAVENLKPVNGLHKLCKWIENRGLRRAAVTNAPRENAELMISIVGLTDFFELLVIGSECERAKPFPDPYLKALEHFNIPSSRAFALEDSPSGLKAAVAAGLVVAGLTTRNPGQELIDAGATLVIKDFEDLDLWNALES